MQLHFEGSSQMNSPREKVYALLTDPAFISSALPDAEEVRIIDGTTFEAEMKLNVAVVSAAVRMKMTVEKTAPPSKARLLAEGGGGGSALKIVSTFDLSGDSPTTLVWSADAEVGGVMAGIGASLLKGFAARKVEELFSGLTSAVEAAK